MRLRLSRNLPPEPRPLTSEWADVVSSAASLVGPPPPLRILHISDLHNRGFRFARALAHAVSPAVVVDTGDLSGIRLAEPFLIGLRYRFTVPLIFAPGNHDSPATSRLIRRTGGKVLDEPRLVHEAGLRFWGYGDPNRTGFLLHGDYDVALCRAAAQRFIPPDEAQVIAVHHEAMVEDPRGGLLLLHGHVHSPLATRRGRTWFLRCGSTGGGGPFGGPLHAAVVDLEEDRVLRIVHLSLAQGGLSARDAF